MAKRKPTIEQPTIKDAAAIIADLLWQISQMRGLFKDEDGTIQAAVDAAEEFLTECGYVKL